MIFRKVFSLLIFSSLFFLSAMVFSDEKPEIVVQSGHASEIYCVAYSPDARFALSGSADTTIRLWDLEREREIRILNGHTDSVFEVAFSPNGKSAASVSTDGTLKLWNIENGREIHSFPVEKHGWGLQCLCFSPSGKNVVSRGESNQLKMWDTGSGREVRSIQMEGEVVSACFSADGERILVGTSKKIRLLNNDGVLLRTFSAHGKAALSPDGKYFASLAAPAVYGTIEMREVETGQLIRKLKGHSGRVKSLDFSPDGTYIASGSEDRSVRIWNAADGRTAGAFTGHQDIVNSVTFSSDCRFVLSGSHDATLKQWDLDDLKLNITLTGHNGWIQTVDWSPDGHWIASGDSDGCVKIWDSETGREYRSFPEEMDDVCSVEFSRDNSILYAGLESGRIQKWDIIRGEKAGTLTGHTKAVNSVSVSPDDTLAVSASWDGKLILWDLESGLKLKILSTDETCRAALFSPDGKSILCTAGNDLKLRDIETGKEIRVFSGHRDSVTSAAISPDGRFALSGSTDKTVRLWNMSDGHLIRTIDGFTDVSFMTGIIVSFSPTGKYFLTGSDEKTVQLWETGSGREVKTFAGNESGISSAKYSPDGHHIVSASGDVIWIFDVMGGADVRTLSGHISPVYTAVLSPDAALCASGSSDDNLKFWDILQGRMSHVTEEVSKPSQWSVPVSMNASTFSSDGRYIITGSDIFALWDVETGEAVHYLTLGRDSGVRFSSVSFAPGKMVAAAGLRSIRWMSETDTSILLWDMETGIQTGVKGHSGGVGAVAFSPDGRYLLSGGWDKTVKMWNADSGEELRTFTGHSDYVNSVAFSPDGRYALSGSADTTIRLWDISTGEEVRTFTGHAKQISSLAFTADGQFFLSGSDDSTMRLWEVATGKELRCFSGRMKWIRSVDIFPDGRYALSGSWDGTTRIWNIETGEWVACISNSNGSEWLIYDSDGYWDASSGGGELVVMVRGMESWNIDQFAVRNNRPDLILRKLPDINPILIRYYYSQYRKRVRRLGLTEEDLGDDYHVPAAGIVASSQSGKKITLDLSFSDTREVLKSYNIYVNDVPLYGAYGRELDGHRRTLSDTIDLSYGENKIEVSCMNSAGIESYRAVTYARYDEPVLRDLYFIGFGVSRYRDASLNLEYADKDVRDLADLFRKQNSVYNNIYVHTFTNEEVTTENIVRAKELLKNAGPDDTFVLAIAGHGVHDDDPEATYYYLTHETNLENLSGTAANFDHLENLLQRIPPRNKLFLMDTCESGEIDEEMIGFREKIEQQSRSLRARGVAVMKMKETEGNSPGLPDDTIREYLFERDRYIYNDLLRRSGTIVFSSCRGGEYSYEDVSLENGFFTYKIKEAVGERLADDDGDGVVTTSELQRYVTEAVSALSSGLQNPTVDRDNIYVDFGF